MKIEFENDWIGETKIKIRAIKSFEGTFKEFQEISRIGIQIEDKEKNGS